MTGVHANRYGCGCLSPESFHGEELLALPYELVWATAWGHDASTMIGPVLGLSELPVVELLMRINADHGLFFKLLVFTEYARGRPFA